MKRIKFEIVIRVLIIIVLCMILDASAFYISNHYTPYDEQYPNKEYGWHE